MLPRPETEMVECRNHRDRDVSILIADDDEALRETLGAAFEPMGFTVYLAPGGTPAVTLVQEKVIDIAILDINMPDLNGFETMRRIRRIRRSVRGIFITSEVSKSVRRRAVSAGPCPIVPKPIRIGTLRYTVQSLLCRPEEGGEVVV